MVNNIKDPIMNNKSMYKIHNLLALAITFIFLTGLPYAVSAQTAQQIAKKAFRSTVLLVMEDTNGQPLSLGSGFFVRDGEIASNLHVVEGAARGYAKLVGQKTKYDIEGVTSVDRKRDLVILKISADSPQALSLGNSDGVQVGESVFAVGNPQGLEGTFSQGIVSSIREVGTDKLLQITAPISPGSSGGPVLNGKGEVIGISVATFQGGQNLNFAIPSNYLKTLLGKARSVKPLIQAKPSKAQRSILADIGGRSTEGVSGGQIQWSWKWHGALAGGYSFSLHNKLREPIHDVACLVVFYDRSGSAIEVDAINFRDIIPGGLARRVTSKVHQSVQELTTPDNSQTPITRVEVRVLDFRITQ